NDLYASGTLVAGRTYRFYVMVHDGDQNKSGGDAGQASFTYTLPGNPPPPPTVQTASLSGHVYLDSDWNGSRSSDEGGLEGWKVALSGTDSLGNAVYMEVYTDRYGNYTFTNLQAGTYELSVSNDGVFATWSATGATVGTVGGTTKGFANGLNKISSITLAAG